MPTRVAALVLCLSAAVCVCAKTGYWLDVPFVKQPTEGCGAASIAMVMQYWAQQGRTQGHSPDVNEIQMRLAAERTQPVAERGVLASVLERYLDEHDFLTYIFHGDAALLAHHIERGRPLIVAFQPASGAQYHYAVVTGIDPDENVVLMNDPAQRKLLKVDLRSFEKQWQATGNWTLLAVPRSAAR